MLTKLAALTLQPFVMVGGVVMNASVMIVEVHEDNTHIVVPVPLALVQVAVAFAPDDVKEVHVPEVAEYLPYFDEVIAALREIPDAELVTVQDGGDHVSIVKEGDLLLINVDEGSGETVRVRLPLIAMERIADSYDVETETFRASRIIGALRAAPSGPFVEVVDGDERVSIRMW